MTRHQVRTLGGLGLTQEQIALIVGMSAKTLAEHYADDLKLGDAQSTQQVAQSLFKKAIGGDVASMIFWMKVRAGWKERGDKDSNSAVTVRVVGGLS